MLNTSRASPWSIPAKHKSSDAQITLGGWYNTERHTHCTPLPQQKATQSSSSWNSLVLPRWNRRSRELPRRPGGQGRAQPSLCSRSLQAKAEPGQASSLSFLIPVPLGHPLVEQPAICRNADGAASTETEGAKLNRRAMSGQDHSKMTRKPWSAWICGAET